VANLGAAFVLCSLIGLEREMRRKSAGLRTHALVGLGSALFVLVSKYGFLDVIAPQIALDPSRMAAQIVSGIGFLGAGLIFVRRDAVRGLTTAAVVWETAAIGAACGAGLLLLGMVVTAAHFLAVGGYPVLASRLPGLTVRQSSVLVRYLDGQAVLRRVLAATTAQGFAVAEVLTHRTLAVGAGDARPAVELELYVQGKGQIEGLLAAVAEIDGVLDVRVSESEE
jgi:putative Mg2+ transporter-C (MgtC) family protein